MAIPNRRILSCPSCSASEEIIIGDSSVGPGGRVSDTPVYGFFGGDMWTTEHRDDEIYISCNSCGAKDFTTVAQVVKNSRRW